MALTVHQIAVGGFDQNFSYIIADTTTLHACIVDPSGDFTQISNLIDTNKYQVTALLLTHTHHDHFDQLKTAKVAYDVPVYVFETGIPAIGAFTAIQPLTDGMNLSVGQGNLNVIHTPGHIDDAVCLYVSANNAEDNIPKVITGDTLFVGGCGRTTELRAKDLYESLRELANLPAETVVYPGHDYGDAPTSTIGREKATNRFYQTKNFTEFAKMRLR